MTSHPDGVAPTELPARVRAANGAIRDDAWMRVGELPLGRRLHEAGVFLIIGLTVGGALLFVPLVHILGILFALALIGIASHRLRAGRVLEAARGICPDCGGEGPFYVGVGRRRFPRADHRVLQGMRHRAHPRSPSAGLDLTLGTRRRKAELACGILLAGCAAPAPGSQYVGETCAASEPLSATRPTAPPIPAFGILVFTRNTGYTHQSIPAAVAAVHVLGTSHGFAVEATEDPNAFADSALSRFRAVVFLNTTGDVLDDRQQAAFERYIGAGGGFVGVHSASDTEADWPWYQGLVGARVAGHPAIQPATINVSGVTHPSTTALPRPWRRTDEWYDYVALPRDVTVLASVDETSYSGGSHGAAHPVTWAHTYRGGRSWYTAMGHTTCSYAERPFLDHLLGGILWAAGIDTGPAPA